MNKLDAGLKELITAQTLDPTSAQCLKNLARGYRANGQREKALEFYQKFLELYPKDEDADSIKGLIAGLQREISTGKNIPSSQGKDNYLEEMVSAGSAHWNLSKMPIRVYLKPGQDQASYNTGFGAALTDAFKEWSEASQGKIQFAFTDSLSNAQISCKWTGDPEHDMAVPNVWGQCRNMMTINGEIQRSEVIIATRYPNFHGPLTVDYMHTVCLHAVGNALGMVGHSTVPSDVMFLHISPDIPGFGLSERDKKTLVAFYSQSDSFYAQHQADSKHLVDLPNNTSPHARAVTITFQGVQDMKAGKIKDAIAKFQQALDLTPSSDTTGRYMEYFNIGQCHLKLLIDNVNLHDYKTAEAHGLKALDFLKLAKRNDVLAHVYPALITAERSLGKTESAEKYEKMQQELQKK